MGALLLMAGCAPGGTGGVGVVVVEIPPAVPASAEPLEAAEPKAVARSVLGRWEGVGEQGSGESWAMVVEVTALGPGVCGRARYPSIPCASEWICAGRSDGRSLEAREMVTEGLDGCIDRGEMSMKVTPEGKLAWRWAGSGETAHAVLSRVTAPR